MNARPAPSRDHGSMSQAEILSDLLHEFRSLVSSGSPVTVEEFISKHAEYESELRQLLPVADALAGLRSDESSVAARARSTFHSPNGTLGDFRLQREIGRGGMGIVYEAEQVSLGRRVALKVFPFATLLDSRQLERFKTEARTAAMLQHRHIVKVLSVGCDRGVHFYAMELINGRSLATVVDQLADNGCPPDSEAPESVDDEVARADRGSSRDDTQPVAALSTQYSRNRSDYFRCIARLGVQVAEALQYAHSQGVLHRDIKPSNLLLDQEGNVYVADFGLARIGEGCGITTTGDVVGTMRYMAPEQLESNHAVDFRSDIYALGATLYELLAGKPLFLAQDRTQLLSQILDTDPTPLRKIDQLIPVDLETIVQKCVARFATDRYATAADVAEDLQRFCDHRPIKATPTHSMQTIRRWVRRNRRLSAALSVAACALLALALGGPFAALRQASLLGEQRSLTSQLEAEKDSLKLERERREQQLYDLHVRAALADLDQGSWRRAVEVVQAFEDSDQTGFEFSLLRNRLDAEQNRTVAAHWCDVTKVAYDPIRRKLAYGTWDGTLVVLDTDSWSELDRHKLADGNVTWIEALQFSPDGRFLLCGGGDTVELRRVSDGSLIPLRGTQPDERTIRVVRSAEFVVANHGQTQRTFVAVGDRSGYNVDDGPAHLAIYEIDETSSLPVARHVATLDSIRGAVNDIAFQPQSNVLLACGHDLMIRRWQLPSLDELESIDVGTMSPHGDGMASIVDVEPHPQQPDVVFFSATKRLVDRSVSRIGALSLSDGRSRHIAARTVGNTSLAISPNGDVLAVGFDDGKLLMFDTASITDDDASLVPRQIVGHASAIHDMVFDPQGRQLFTASADTTVKVWQIDQSPLRAETKQDVVTEMVFTSAMKWLSDGRRIVSAQATDQPMLRLWDRNTGKQLQTCPVPQRLFVTDLCVASDRHIAFGAYEWPSSQGTAMVGLWDLVTNEVQTLGTASGRSSHVAMSSDQQYLIAGLGDDIAVIDFSTKTVRYRHGLRENSPVATHPQQNLCAFVSGDDPTQSELPERGRQKRNDVVIWDAEERRVVATLPGDETITSLAFSPDGKKLAAGSARGPILLWADWELARDSREGSDPQKLVGHGMHVWDLEFSVDSRRIASAALDRTVRLWNASTGNELMQIRTQAEWNYVVTFNPEGNSLAYAGGKGSPFGAIHVIDASHE